MVFCSFANCSYSTKSWLGYRSHVSRNHRNQIVYNEQIEVPDEDIITDVELSTSEQKHMLSGAFALSLEAKFSLSQKATDNVVNASHTFVQEHISLYRAQIKAQLEERGLPNDILDNLPIETFLDELNADYKRCHLYTSKFGYIKPESVLLGSKYITIKGRLKEQFGYIIPFILNIKSLLELPEVWDYVCNSHYSQNEFMFDICDGQYIRNCDFFRDNPKALQILLNTDDIEIVNPLGSHTKKHKLSMFYFTLANIPPAYRSSLHSIQLLGVAKSVDIRISGAEPLLRQFILDVNEMSTTGINMTIANKNVIVKGALVICPCDTPAANWLGGFKEGVGFALKACRMCNLESKDMKRNFKPASFPLRNVQEHMLRLENLETLSRDAKTYWSKLWGINYRSCLTSLVHFDICTAVVQDPMHIFLEGILPYEMKLMLYDFIYASKFFKLQFLNSKLKSFSYTYLESNSVPQVVNKTAFQGCGSLKQSSSELYQLCLILPILIGHKIPRGNEKWMNFLRLVQCLLLSTSPYCSDMTPSLLEQLLYDHHMEFFRLYPKASILPKMHYALHLPTQMKLYGPCRFHWCMRFEAKHGFFKDKRWKCYKNLPLSVANLHQKHQCYKRLGPNGCRSRSFLSQGDIIAEGKLVEIHVLYPDIDTFLHTELEVHDHAIIYSTGSMVLNGLHYKPGCFIVHKYDQNEPKFVEVIGLFTKEEERYFVVQHIDGQYFDSHLLSYVCTSYGQKSILAYSRIIFKWPISKHYVNGNRIVVNKYSHTCEFL